MFIGERVYDVAVRFPESVRNSADAISRCASTTIRGAMTPLVAALPPTG